MNEKQIIIITLNYNQNEYTLKCIDSILSSNYNNYKLLLIDNGSKKEIFNKLKNSLPKDNRIFVYRIEKNRGYVGGINFGLEKGVKFNPNYFLIMNNDTIIEKNAIRELVTTAEKYKQNVIVTGKVYYYDEPNKLQDIGYTFKNKRMLQFNRIGLNEIDVGKYDTDSERDMIDDVFWLFPANLYEKIGGYSPYFWFNAEQADFALRAKKLGYKLIYTPKAKLWHKGSVSIGGRYNNPRLAYWHIQSTLIFRYLHLSRIEFIKQYFQIMIGILGSFLKAGFNKNYDYPKAKLKAFLYFNKWLWKRNVNNGSNPFER